MLSSLLNYPTRLITDSVSCIDHIFPMFSTDRWSWVIESGETDHIITVICNRFDSGRLTKDAKKLVNKHINFKSFQAEH